MSIEIARAHLRGLGMEDRIRELEQSSATVELAAAAIGCEPGMIAKTLAFQQKDGPVLVLAAGDVRVDNKKYKAVFQEKAKMIPWDDVEEQIGHAPGGVCPFGVKPEVRVFLDESLKKYNVVYPAAGTDHSMAEMNLEELERCSGSLGWVLISK
ncbi:MAG: YbaK/EbsC family protein [Firmicutes bacterium]|nr:YbaK/EbsC family protein [Bacillota bacterium]